MSLEQKLGLVMLVPAIIYFMVYEINWQWPGFTRIKKKLRALCTAAKGGIAALTHALAMSLAGKARVNTISPGWIDTAYTVYNGPDAVQQPAGRVGNPLDIANMVLFLCSDKAGFVIGENICIDGGMTRQMIYHGDHGWKLEK